MKVVIFEAEEWEARACRALSGNHELTCVKERLTSDNAAKYSDAEVISTFINYIKMVVVCSHDDLPSTISDSFWLIVR